jgi:hypothetical protein
MLICLFARQPMLDAFEVGKRILDISHFRLQASDLLAALSTCQFQIDVQSSVGGNHQCYVAKRESKSSSPQDQRKLPAIGPIV